MTSNTYTFTASHIKDIIGTSTHSTSAQLPPAVGHWDVGGTRFPIYLNPPNKIRQLIIGLLLGWKYIPNTNTKQLLNG
jgi:hypothetical protein